MRKKKIVKNTLQIIYKTKKITIEAIMILIGSCFVKAKKEVL